MNPADMAEFLKSMESIAGFLSTIGIPGMLTVVLSTPALVVALILYLNHSSQIRLEKVVNMYREDSQDIMQQITEKMDKFVDSQDSLLRQLEKESRQNLDLQTLIVNNTMAMEQLKCAIKSVTG